MIATSWNVRGWFLETAGAVQKLAAHMDALCVREIWDFTAAETFADSLRPYILRAPLPRSDPVAGEAYPLSPTT